MRLTDVLTVCRGASELASEAILRVYHTDFTVLEKEDKSPVTQADLAADALIREVLAKEYPEVPILSEETKDDPARLRSDWCFIVDPLDGTKGFVAHNGEFTVNIALAYRQRVVVGVIQVPVTGEMYYAAQGIGAYYQDEPIHVSDSVKNLRMVGSKNHSRPEEKELSKRPEVSEMVQTGSSIKGCLVARGEADVYYRFGPTSEWDTAAMQCVCEQAGAIFRQMDGSELLYNREDIRNRKGFYIVNRAENIWV